MKSRVGVIGGGVAGLTAAIRALDLGADVVVFERSHVGSGSSSLSAGVFSVNQLDRLSLEIRIAARNYIDWLEHERGLNVSRDGYLRLASTPEQLTRFEDAVNLQRQLGSEPSTVLDVCGLRSVVPELQTDDLVGGMLNHRDGRIDGSDLCNILANEAVAGGALIHTNAPVVEAQNTEGGAHVLISPRATYECDFVVNAAGPWAARTGDILGQPLPLVNQRHEILLVKLPPDFRYSGPFVQEYVPGAPEGVYFGRETQDTLIAGLHSHDVLDSLTSEDPDEYSHAIEWDVVERVAGKLAHRLVLEGMSVGTGWCGLYPVSPDAAYIVGPYAADPTIVALGGLAGAGLASGLAVGRVAAEWALIGRPETVSDATPFLPDRPSLAAKTTVTT
jgi:glycine/D-amino acid oxidase-like deaminating enzyme